MWTILLKGFIVLTCIFTEPWGYDSKWLVWLKNKFHGNVSEKWFISKIYYWILSEIKIRLLTLICERFMFVFLKTTDLLSIYDDPQKITKT